MTIRTTAAGVVKKYEVFNVCPNNPCRERFNPAPVLPDALRTSARPLVPQGGGLAIDGTCPCARNSTARHLVSNNSMLMKTSTTTAWRLLRNKGNNDNTHKRNVTTMPCIEYV